MGASKWSRVRARNDVETGLIQEGTGIWRRRIFYLIIANDCVFIYYKPEVKKGADGIVFEKKQLETIMGRIR